MARFICKRRPNYLKTCAANWGPLSEIALSGSPYRRHKEFRSIDAVPMASIVLWQGSKITPFHDQNRIKTIGQRKIGDEIHSDEREGSAGTGFNRLQRGVRGVTVDLVLLTGGTA